MPLDERFRLDDDKRISPVKESSECDHRQPRCRRGWTRLHLAVFEERKLFPQK